MTSYLVTGGAGFIGSHIAIRLLREGHRVRVLDNLATGRKENLDAVRAASPAGGRFEFLEGDIRSLETCRSACEGMEFVLHQAALASVQRSIENPADTTAVNVLGLVNVLTAAKERGVRRAVCASSSSVYGDTPTLPKHEDMVPAPLSRLMGVRAEPRFLPPRPGDVRHSQASIQLAAQELGFHPRVTFEEGLTRTVEHFRHAV